VRRTLVEIRSDSTAVTVSGTTKSELSRVDPAVAFAHLSDSIKSNAGPATSYDIACGIAFDFAFGDKQGDRDHDVRTPDSSRSFSSAKPGPKVAATLND
jgi:hypothetical protein